MKHNFEYLRPPKEASRIKHKPEYVHKGTDKTARRRIYCQIEYEPFEEAQIEDLQAAAKSNGITLPNNWTAAQSLRFLYSADFEVLGDSGAISRIERHLQFLLDREFNQLSSEGQEILENGLIYQYGRDEKYRPFIIINANKFDTNKVSVESFLNALTILLEVIKKYMLVPGVVENWIVLIDCTDVTMPDLLNVLKKGIDILSVNFPEYLETLFLLNLSKPLTASWKMITGSLLSLPRFEIDHIVFQKIALIPQKTLEKIIFVNSKDTSRLLEVIPSDQLEQRFGGILPDLTTKFWPPQKTFGISADSDFERPEQSSSFLEDSGFNQLENLVTHGDINAQRYTSNVEPESFTFQENQRLLAKSVGPEFRNGLISKNQQSLNEMGVVGKSEEIETSKLTRSTVGKQQTQEFFGKSPSSRNKRSTQSKEDGATSHSVKVKPSKLIKPSMDIKPFKEDAFYKVVSNNQSETSGKESTERETRGIRLNSQDNVVEQEEKAKDKKNKEYFSYLNQGNDNDSLWYQRIMEDGSQKNLTQSNDTKWFCGYCTIRKSKDQPK